MKLEDHPTVRRFREGAAPAGPSKEEPLDAEWLRQLVLDAGADDVGQPDLRVTADAQTWIGFLRKEKNVVWALLRRKIVLDGPLSLLVAFGNCFPS